VKKKEKSEGFFRRKNLEESEERPVENDFGLLSIMPRGFFPAFKVKKKGGKARGRGGGEIQIAPCQPLSVGCKKEVRKGGKKRRTSGGELLRVKKRSRMTPAAVLETFEGI